MAGITDGLRYSLFSAAVVVSEEEQPDRAELDQQAPLRHLPRISEGQIPGGGPGLPPPSQPFLKDMEPDLPTIDRAISPNFDQQEQG